MNTTILIITSAAVIFGGIISFAVLGKRRLISLEKKQKEAQNLIEESKKEAERVLEETKNTIGNFRKRSEEDRIRVKKYTDKMEETLRKKETYIGKHEERNKKTKEKIIEIEKGTKSLEEKGTELEKKVTQEIAKKIGTSMEQEHKSLIENLIKQSKKENDEKLIRLEERLRENAEREARETLKDTMQRLIAPTSVEKRGEEIQVKRDHIKGEIVGPKAENTELIEEELSVDIVFNDRPNTITAASYNLLNQHIATKTIEALTQLKDKKITKDRVKEAVKTAKKTVENELEKVGKEVADKLGLRIKSQKLYELIGRLQFRTSYGQNILKHSLEVAWISMMLGSELGLDVEICKTAGLLHDLGKAIDQNPDVKGAHDILTKELMEELGFSEAEVHAAWTHHEAEPPKTPEAMIVKAADAVSAGRPGARQETLEKYLERLHLLEETADSFEGVRKSYAISAGREIRVIVDPQEVDDAAVKKMAGSIAKEIEERVSYPGKIKVNVIRRVKALDVAK